MNRDLILSLGILLASGGCVGGTATPCEEAADQVMTCFGEELVECNESVAARINGNSCEEIAALADPEGKADGFCPSWLRWICADGPVYECPTAGERGDYAQFSSEERMNYHWEWAQCTEYGEGDNPALERDTWDLIVDTARGAVTTVPRMARAFTNSSDELDTGRVKLLHPYGAMAQLRWVAAPTDSSCDVEYTGVLDQEEQSVLTRFSLGADPRLAGYMPGVALKFFVEGQDSVNYHAIRGAGMDPSFFSQQISNVIPPQDGPAMKAVLEFLGLFANDASRLRLDALASWNPDGTQVESPVIPYEIELVPTAEALEMYESALEQDADVDYREALATIAAGTPVYEVHARAEEGGCMQHISTLTTETRFISGVWSDRRLQFQHSTTDQGFDE